MEETNPLAASRPLTPRAIVGTVAAAASKHPEAFRLMLYVSDDGARIETVWNTRDGVTPFVIGGRGDAGAMKHEMWGGDPFARWHVPNVGDRVFVDMTHERAVELARQYVERYWDDEAAPMSALGFESKDMAVVHFAQEWTRHAGAPDVVEVTPELQRHFLELRRSASMRSAQSPG